MTFNPKAAGDYVRDLLTARGDGAQSDLARHLNISVPSVNRWAKGKNQPDMGYWPGIEDFFGLSHGTLTVIALGGPLSPELVSALNAALELLDASDEPGVDRIRPLIVAVIEELQRGGDASGNGVG